MSWLQNSTSPATSQQHAAPPTQSALQAQSYHQQQQQQLPRNATPLTAVTKASNTSPHFLGMPAKSGNVSGSGGGGGANTSNGPSTGNLNLLGGRVVGEGGGGGGSLPPTTTTIAPVITPGLPTQMFEKPQQQQHQLTTPTQNHFSNQKFKEQLQSQQKSKITTTTTSPNWQQQNIIRQQQQQPPPQQHQQQQKNVTTTMMPPTVAASNNWQQQQQQHPHANLYQQQPTQQPQQQVNQQQQLNQQQLNQQQLTQQQLTQQHPTLPANNWQDQMPQQPPAANHVYGTTIYGQPQHQQPMNQMYAQQQQQQPPVQQQHDTSSFFQQQHQQQQAATQQPQQHEYFVDNTNNNNVSLPGSTTNGVGKSDGWGDWDWNDNTNDYQPQQQQRPASQQQQLQQPLQQQQLQQQQQLAQHLHQQQPPQQQPPQQQPPQQQPPQQHQQPPPQQPPPQNHQQQQKLSDPNDNLQKSIYNPNIIEDSFSTSSNDNWHWNVSEEQPADPENSSAHTLNTIVGDQPTVGNDYGQMPTVTAGSLPEATNENFNQIPLASAAENQQAATAASAGVYVSQAKPVARPPRQYASLLADTVNTENALTPPQAFRNDNVTLDPQQQQQLVQPPPLGGIPQVPPTVAQVTTAPPPAAPAAVAVPPPAVLPPPIGGSAASNPFKRAGAAQHHRANALLSSNSNTLPPPPNVEAAQPLPLTQPATANAFSLPPPPPADFANPMDSENNEDFHENQEVVPIAAVAAPQLTLPNADRNQYLQTSHLSENPDYESANLEGDSLLPPPGLSRLVLGQPELAEAASQRMVTGTEEPSTAMAMPSSNLDIEERHADGQDTSVEQQTLMMPPQPDRNRYMVPGESLAVNEQRVVTGVENITVPVGVSAVPVQSVGNSSNQIISEQREIVLDGENLEDLEQQQQQQQHQQQQQLQNQQQQQHQQQQHQQHTLSRNEPPLEGAVSASLPQASANVDLTLAGEPPHSAKSKDTLSLTNASTGNDESDPLLEEDFDDEDQDHHHRGHGRYSAKSRGSSKYDVASTERSKHEKLRKDKQRAVDRSESEESEEELDDDYNLSMRERDRRRNYREGSVRSDREDREYKDNSRRQRRDKRESGDKFAAGNSSRDKYYYGGGGGNGNKSDRARSQRYSSRYDQAGADSSKYETEESTRQEGGRGKDSARRSMRSGGGGAPNTSAGGPVDDRRSDRSERDYDDYQRRYRGSKRGDKLELSERERRDRYGGESGDHEQRRRDAGGRHYRRDRDDYDTNERRRRSDKHRSGEASAAAASAREYEEYRKQSSRNARESDLEKEGGGRGARGGVADPRYDPRMHGGAGAAAQMAMYGGYPGYAYDPTYAAYYYEQMARTNPQAYSEWYKKYYGHAAAVTGSTSGVAAAAAASGQPQHHGAVDHLSLARDEGRESVHSGRSSIAALHSDKDRYTQAYISQANEYHHHQQQQQLQQHQLQQQQRQLYHNYSNQYQQQQHVAYANVSLLDDGDGSVTGMPLAGSVMMGGDRLNSARSIGNLSQSGGYYGSTTMMAAENHHQNHHHHHQQYHQRPHPQHHQYYARSEYADSRSGNLSMRDPEPDPQRLTPCKFINEHTVVSIAGGILVTVKPKYTPHGSISNVVKLQRIYANDGMRHLYQTYPGPLVRGLTHKKTIIEFCEEQIRLGPMQTTIYAKQLLPNNVDKYKASYTLMWNLLILLLRQNGMVVGTDIAELLLKNQQQFPYPLSGGNSASSIASSPQQAKSIAATSDGSEADYDKLSDEVVAQDEQQQQEQGEKDITEVNTADDVEKDDKKLPEAVETVNTPSVKTLTDDEITEKFRNYLLYGNVNEALDWATDNNLWGHALFLASKVDRRSHANVMMKFANKLSLNDPLQTLYQLMSGRTPSSVTSVQDEKWGDWRPHLSMILSNTSQKPELDRKAITTLGDSLFNRGDLFAAHFCYLMAQVGFGRYQESAVGETTLQQSLPKLVLLGSSHYKSLRDFATNESIMMTEIYEYACSLNDDKFSLVEFQPYKYMLASRMADYGFHLKSLMYMEQIALHIERDSSKYEPSFIQKIYDLADRLKYYDPVLEKTLDDQQHNLEGSGAGGPQNFEEQKWLQNLRNTVSDQKVDSSGYENQSVQYQNQIDQQFAEINKQFNELNLQYANDNLTEPQPAPPPSSKQQQDMDVSSVVQPQFYNPDTMAAAHQLNDTQQQAEYQASQQQQQQPTELVSSEHANYAQPQYMQPDTQLQQQQQNAYYDPQQQQQQQQHYNALDNSAMLQQQQQQANYDYWSAQQQPSYGDENAAQRPTISLPKTKSYDSDEDKRKKQQQKGGSGGDAAKNAQQQQQRAKNDNKDKIAPQGNQNSGWFGGIWNKLSLKPKNQMILPDDKNPSIVWDPEKKRWVNTTDGDEATEEALKPPPKMSDIVTQAQQQYQQQLQPPQQQQLQQPPPQQQYQQPPQQQYSQQQQQPQYTQQPPQASGAPQLPLMDATSSYGQLTGGPVEMPPSGGFTTAPSPAPAVPVTNEQTMPAAAATVGQPKPPNLQSNMFKMQRNRTLKNSYVDVFNPSGAPMSSAADSVLAPALPPAAVPQGGFFIPGPAPAVTNESQSGGYQQQPQQQQDVPQFYNPNQYGNAAPTGPGGY